MLQGGIMLSVKRPKSLSLISARPLIQAGFSLVCLWIGWRFCIFLQSLNHPVRLSRPASVEAFLPISALLGLKRLFLTGAWDPVHPAGLALFLSLLAGAFLFRKAFCGYVCPVGFVSGLLERIGRRLGLARTGPRLLDRILTSLKYILLFFFLKTVFSMDLMAIEQFIRSPFNITADARMFRFFSAPSMTTLGVLFALAILSIVFRNAWCRWLCPYGALLGLFSWLSPAAVHREVGTCIGCGRCDAACPSGIPVSTLKTIRRPGCIGCGNCVEVCPANRGGSPDKTTACLSFEAFGSTLPRHTVALGTAGVILAAWLAASAAGYWDSMLPEAMVRKFYIMGMG